MLCASLVVQTPHFTRHTPHSNFTLHFALHTLLFTLHSSCPTLHTSHCALHTPHFTLHTSSHLSSSHLYPSSSLLISSLLICHLSFHKSLPSATSYYKTCTKYCPSTLYYFPVLRCATELAQNTSQYYRVLQSLHKALPSTTLYYKPYTKHFSVLVWRAQWEVWSMKRSFKCDIWNRTPLSQNARTHGPGWSTAHAGSIDEKGLIVHYP